MKSWNWLCGASMVAAMAVSAPAMAQTDVAPAASADDSTGDIIVTARRREENLQSTPIAVTAFSQRALDEKSIRSPLDLSKTVPGLQAVTTPGASQNISFAIRGRGTNYGAAAGSVETYFAEVPLSSPFQRPGLPPQFFDLSSFQVLKGPQGTLFGRSTTGGAVLIVPAAPKLGTVEGYARLQVGNYDNFQGEAAINVPLGEKAALRIAGFAWHRKGYNRTVAGITDLFGKVLPSIDIDNQDVYEVRTSLLLQPTDNLTNTTIFTYHADKNRGAMMTTAVRAGTFGIGTDPFAAIPVSVVQPAAGPRVMATDVDLSRGWSNTWAIINTTTLELADNLKLKNIFGYIKAQDYSSGPSDTDGLPIGGINSYTPRRLENTQITEELQLQGSLADGKADFILGGLIDLTRNPYGKNINLYTASCCNGGTGFNHQFLSDRVNAKSVFGSVTGHLSDKLALTVGARYAHEVVSQVRYDVQGLSSLITVIPDNYLNPANNLATKNRVSFSGMSYNVGLEYKANSDTLIYGGYRHGWKRGGINTSPPSPALAVFQPEKDDDFYIGLKQDLSPLGLSGHFNIEAFYDLYYGSQNTYLTVTSTGLSVVVDNSEKQTYRGFDMDFSVAAAPWLDISGGYTFVDAKINKWTDRTWSNLSSLVDPSTDLSVNPVPYVSKHKLSLTGRLHTELGDGSEIALIPSMTYQSKFYSFANAVRQTNSAAALFLGGKQLNSASYGVGVVPSYTLADLRLEWNHVAGSKVDLAVNATNLFNKTYLAGGNGGVYVFGFAGGVYGAPRMVTAELKIRF